MMGGAKEMGAGMKRWVWLLALGLMGCGDDAPDDAEPDALRGGGGAMDALVADAEVTADGVVPRDEGVMDGSPDAGPAATDGGTEQPDVALPALELMPSFLAPPNPIN